MINYKSPFTIDNFHFLTSCSLFPAFPWMIYQLTGILHNFYLFSLEHLLYIWQPNMVTLRQQKCCFGPGLAEMPGQRLVMVKLYQY